MKKSTDITPTCFRPSTSRPAPAATESGDDSESDLDYTPLDVPELDTSAEESDSSEPVTQQLTPDYTSDEEDSHPADQPARAKSAHQIHSSMLYDNFGISA